MVRRFKTTIHPLLRVNTGRRQLCDRQSERLAHTTARLRLIREARRRPPDEQLLQRRAGLDNREVVAPREGPILESLASRAALFYIGVGSSRRHDIVRKALCDYDGSLY